MWSYGSSYGEIILDYLEGPIVNTKILIKRRQRRRRDDRGRGQSDVAATQGMWATSEAGKGQEQVDSPWNLQKEYGSIDTLMLNPFLTPDLQTNKLILP